MISFPQPIRLPLAFLMVMGSLCAQVPTVDLYFEASTGSQKVDSVPLDDPRLGQAAPVLDSQRAADGWHYAEFRDTVTGFVPDAKIGKDLLPVDNAIVYSRPDSASPVLGVYREGDNLEIVDTGAWWEIRLTIGFPVYFQLDRPPPLPPVTGTAEAPLVEIPEEPAPAEPPVFEEGPLLDPPAANPPGLELSGPQPPDIPDNVVSRRYEGVFKQSGRRLGLFAPKAPFYLEGSEGSRIGWVDTSGIVLPGSLKEFIDKPVILHGEREMLEGSRDWIIRARNMRLK